jgi:hypothetical protein
LTHLDLRLQGTACCPPRDLLRALVLAVAAARPVLSHLRLVEARFFRERVPPPDLPDVIAGAVGHAPVSAW